jgi:dTDP-4-dehydrorhamnose reductase
MKNYKFLILGSNGLLGSKIVRILKDRKIRYLTVARTNSDFNLDLKNYDKLEKFFLHKKFDILINCAAIVNIDFCEKNYNDALIFIHHH